MKKLNFVVWPAPSSKFLKIAHGPISLATPAVTLLGIRRDAVVRTSSKKSCFKASPQVSPNILA